MVGKTREEAVRTRTQIIEAARRVFSRQGVAGTTLDEVASAAGVTRGAIYWHFRNKRELFAEMRQQVTLPMMDRMAESLVEPAAGGHLAALEQFLCSIMTCVTGDPRTRDTLRIMHFKCEYVTDLEEEYDRQVLRMVEMRRAVTAAYRRAARAGELDAAIRPAVAATETTAFIIGLVRLALMEEDAPVAGFQSVIRAHIAQKRPSGVGQKNSSVNPQKPQPVKLQERRRQVRSPR